MYVPLPLYTMQTAQQLRYSRNHIVNPKLAQKIREAAQLGTHLLNHLQNRSDTPETSLSSAMPQSGQQDSSCDICSKPFPNKAQLRNHITIFHPQSTTEAATSSDFTLVHDAVQEIVRTESHESDAPGGAGEPDELSDDPEDATITAISRFDPEKTVKAVPHPVTEESLRVHNASSTVDIDLGRSLTNLSISGQDFYEIEDATSEISIDTTYTVDDSDDLPLSEVADSDSPVIRLAVAILLFCWSEFVQHSDRRGKGFVESPAYSDNQSYHSAASTSRESVQTPSVTSSQVSGVRRPREPDDDGEEDNRQRQRKRREIRAQAPDGGRPLACPFNKFDSTTFGVNGQPQYHVCSTWSDVKSAYFKQHLIRTHCMPEYHCDRCGEDFKNAGKLREHRRVNPPCELRELDVQKIMPEIQDELGLRTRNAVKTNRIKYWERVFDLLFDQQTRIDRNIEPYYEGPLAQNLGHFVQFSRARMPAVLSTIRERTRLIATVEDDAEFGMQVLQEAMQAYIANHGDPQSINIRDLQRPSATNSETELISPTGQQRPDVARRERQFLGPTPAPQLDNIPSTNFGQPVMASQQNFFLPNTTMNLPSRPAAQADAPAPSYHPTTGYEPWPDQSASTTPSFGIYNAEDFEFDLMGDSSVFDPHDISSSEFERLRYQ